MANNGVRENSSEQPGDTPSDETARVTGKETPQGDEVSPDSIASNPPAQEASKATSVPQTVSSHSLQDIITAGLACGMPMPGSSAMSTWITELAIGLTPYASPGWLSGILPHSLLHDDHDGVRACQALYFAWRRNAERAVTTGEKFAVATEQLLRFILIAATTGLSDGEQANREAAVIAAASEANDHLRKWASPQHDPFAQYLRENPPGLYGGITPANESPQNRLRREAATRCGHDLTNLYRRCNSHVPEEFCDEPDLVRAVVMRANDALIAWSNKSPIYPNREADGFGRRRDPTSRDESNLAPTLVGTLSRGLPHRTHSGSSFKERLAFAQKVASAIADQLNSRREGFREQLFNGECQDALLVGTGSEATELAKRRDDVAFRIAACAFIGLNIANGAEPKQARKDAENALSKLRKQKKT
ncbi:MAG: hypothetical protein U0271_47975 [Polyangiaceae bacterium]